MIDSLKVPDDNRSLKMFVHRYSSCLLVSLGHLEPLLDLPYLFVYLIKCISKVPVDGAEVVLTAGI